MEDNNYPQYQFFNGGPMQQPQFDQKYLNDTLLNKLFQTQAQQQLLSAFTPAQGGMSFLEQLLSGMGAGGGSGGGAPNMPSMGGGGSNPLFPTWGPTKPITSAPAATSTGGGGGYMMATENPLMYRYVGGS
jgi:hypothetical protein